MIIPREYYKKILFQTQKVATKNKQTGNKEQTNRQQTTNKLVTKINC